MYKITWHKIFLSTLVYFFMIQKKQDAYKLENTCASRLKVLGQFSLWSFSNFKDLLSCENQEKWYRLRVISRSKKSNRWQEGLPFHFCKFVTTKSLKPGELKPRVTLAQFPVCHICVKIQPHIYKECSFSKGQTVTVFGKIIDKDFTIVVIQIKVFRAKHSIAWNRQRKQRIQQETE